MFKHKQAMWTLLLESPMSVALHRELSRMAHIICLVE